LQTEVKNNIIDVPYFQKKDLEITNELKLAQESLCKSLEIIQKQYNIIDDSLEFIVDREKELASTQHKFQ